MRNLSHAKVEKFGRAELISGIANFPGNLTQITVRGAPMSALDVVLEGSGINGENLAWLRLLVGG